MRLLQSLLLALGMCFVSLTAAAHPLDQLYVRALERNEAYVTALMRAKTSQSALRQTASTAWPTVSADFGTAFGTFPGITGNDEGETKDNPERYPTLTATGTFQLNIRQQLYQFGRLDAELERDDWQSRAAWLAVTQAQAQVQKDIALAYLNARAAIAANEARERQLTLLFERLGTVQQRVQEGFLDRNDLLSVLSEVSNAQVSLVESQRARAIALASLERLTFTTTVLVDRDQLALLMIRLPSSLNEALLFANENAIDILMAETMVRAANAGEWAVARSSLPSFSWSVSHARGVTNTNVFNNDQLPNNGVSQSGTQDTRIGFNLSVPIFAGGRELERRNQARDQVQLALRQLNSTREGVDAEIRRQWALMEAEQAAMNQWHNMIQLEQQRVQNAERLLEEGFINLEEAIQARARLQGLQIQIVNTSANIARAKLEILHFLGLL